MRYSLKIVVLLAALTFALQPLALCFSAEMTRSEEECCHEMAGDCGQVPMPTSHSCCNYVGRPESARPEAKNSHLTNSTLAVVLPESQDAVSAEAPVLMALGTPTESPPRSRVVSLQVLRI